MITYEKLQETNTKIIYRYTDEFGDSGTIEFSKTNYEDREVSGENKQQGRLHYSVGDISRWAQKIVSLNFPQTCIFRCGY